MWRLRSLSTSLATPQRSIRYLKTLAQHRVSSLEFVQIPHASVKSVSVALDRLGAPHYYGHGRSTINVEGHVFTHRYVDTLLRIINQYTNDPGSLTIICNERKKLPEYVLSFERHHAQIMTDPVNDDREEMLFVELRILTSYSKHWIVMRSSIAYCRNRLESR